MKRVGYITDKDGRHITLLEAMGDYGNVQKAYNKARKCKRHRKDVLIFTKDKEENLDKVREDILNLAYEPSEYHYFKVYEPKERQYGRCRIRYGERGVSSEIQTVEKEL